MEVRGALSSLHFDEHLRSACSSMGRRSQLALHGPCNPVKKNSQIVIELGSDDALRLATDLNLHQPSFAKPQSEKHEREILNKARVWLICCNLDRSTAAQFGKPSTIKE